MSKNNTIVKVNVPYIRYISPTKVLIGKNWYESILCDKRKLPNPPPYNMQAGVVELPLYVAKHIT